MVTREQLDAAIQESLRKNYSKFYEYGRATGDRGGKECCPTCGTEYFVMHGGSYKCSRCNQTSARSSKGDGIALNQGVIVCADRSCKLGEAVIMSKDIKIRRRYLTARPKIAPGDMVMLNLSDFAEFRLWKFTRERGGGYGSA